MKFEDLERVGSQGCEGLTDSLEGCESLQDDLTITLEGKRVVEAESLGQRALLIEQGAFVEVEGQTLEKLGLCVERSEIQLIAVRVITSFPYHLKLTVIPRVFGLFQQFHCHLLVSILNEKERWTKPCMNSAPLLELKRYDFPQLGECFTDLLEGHIAASLHFQYRWGDDGEKRERTST